MPRKANFILGAGLLAAAALGAAEARAQNMHKIGYIGDLSGAMQDSYAPILEALEFYVKALNERGGIKGVPVKLSVRNDQLDATRAAAMSLELATAEGVNSIWGMSQTRTHMAVYQVAQRHKVPAIAMFSGIKEVLPPKPVPFAYSIGHVFEVAGEVSGKLAGEMLKGKGKIVCGSIEAPGGVAVCQFVEGAGQAAGLQSDTVLFPPPTTEYGAIAQRMIGMQPTLVVAHVGAGQNVGLFRALRGAGYTGAILMGSHGLNETPLVTALKSAGGIDKLQIVSRFASPDGAGKELDELRAAAKKYGKKDPISTTSIMGWVTGKVMETALTQCGYPCSGEKLDGVLQSTTFEMGSLMGGPIKFAEGDHYGTSWWRVYRFDEPSGKFVAASNWIEASSNPTLRKK